MKSNLYIILGVIVLIQHVRTAIPAFGEPFRLIYHDKTKENIMLKKLTCVILALTTLFCIFSGCNDEVATKKFNAVLYSKAKTWIDEDFLKENKVYGMRYPNENDEYIQDTTSPKSRTFIITQEEEFKSIFTNYTSAVNFDKQMVVLYIFCDISPRVYILKDVNINKQNLTLYCQLKQSDKKDAVEPYQRCFMVVLDKNNIDTAKFIELVPSGCQGDKEYDL